MDPQKLEPRVGDTLTRVSGQFHGGKYALSGKKASTNNLSEGVDTPPSPPPLGTKHQFNFRLDVRWRRAVIIVLFCFKIQEPPRHNCTEGRLSPFASGRGADLTHMICNVSGGNAVHEMAVKII